MIVLYVDKLKFWWVLLNFGIATIFGPCVAEYSCDAKRLGIGVEV